MAENEKTEIRHLSTQALYNTFHTCLAEIINRGLNVYYSPSENPQNGQAHLNFPIESCGNVKVFESQTENDQQGWTYQDGPGGDEQAENDGSTADEDQTNLVRDVQNDDGQYDYNASSSEVYTFNSYQEGQQNGDEDANFNVRENDVIAQESGLFMAHAIPTAPDYGTCPNTSESSLSSYFIPEHPGTSTPSPPLSDEEKWSHAVSFTAAVMNNFPHCKEWSQCFFNPDGPRLLPQTVEEVPTGAPIRELLHARKGIIRDIKYCSNLCSRLRTQQKHMIDRGFVVVRTASPPPKKSSPVREAPSYDAVLRGDKEWWKKRKERRKI